MRPNDSTAQNPAPSTPALGCGQTASGVPGVPVEGQLAFEGSRSTEGVKRPISSLGANGGASDGESASQSPRAEASSTADIVWTIKPAVDIAAQVITLDIHTKMKDMTDTVTREFCKLKEKAVRRALISAGWTPPEWNAKASPDAGAGSQVPQTGWVSVKERRPRVWEHILFATEYTGRFSGHLQPDGEFHDAAGCIHSPVTHWCEFPPPPEDFPAQTTL